MAKILTPKFYNLFLNFRQKKYALVLIEKMNVIFKAEIATLSFQCQSKLKKIIIQCFYGIFSIYKMCYFQCHAIRDAQILEKEQIKEDISGEERRLDVIMEVHRLNAIKDAETIESLKAAKRIEGAKQIMDQIKANTVVRILEEEKKNAER